jgi:hypothetical protein
VPSNTRIPSPDAVLASLKQAATIRTQRSLDILHAICQEQHRNGSRDFSVSTIGRLSAQRGGPSTQPIRNKSGEHYRALLTAWASHADGLTRKPTVRAEPGVADDILGMIDDASVRAVVGVILAENRKLKGENTLLKQQANVVVDRRPQRGHVSVAESVEPSAAEVSSLLPIELDALGDAVSEEFLQRMGWTVDKKNGRVVAGNRNVYRPGYYTAIKKLLAVRANAAAPKK